MPDSGPPDPIPVKKDRRKQVRSEWRFQTKTPVFKPGMYENLTPEETKKQIGKASDRKVKGFAEPS